jgi:hypothetical protein
MTVEAVNNVGAPEALNNTEALEILETPFISKTYTLRG